MAEKKFELNPSSPDRNVEAMQAVAEEFYKLLQMEKTLLQVRQIALEEVVKDLYATRESAIPFPKYFADKLAFVEDSMAGMAATPDQAKAGDYLRITMESGDKVEKAGVFITEDPKSALAAALEGKAVGSVIEVSLEGVPSKLTIDRVSRKV